MATTRRRSRADLHASPPPPETPKPKRPKAQAAATKAVVEELKAAIAPLQVAAVFRDEDDIRRAVEHVLLGDPLLAPLIEEHGHPLKLIMQQGNTFQSLSKTVIYQQLHGKAAAAIHARFLTLCKEPLVPANVLSADRAALRACGLSERKVEYLVALAQRFEGQQLGEEDIRGMSDQDLKETLTQVKGIGPWSVDMLCMFSLGRRDVLPVGDLAVRKGMQALYGLPALPSPAQMEALARKWEPYRSIGTYLMWRVPTVKASPKPKAPKSPTGTATPVKSRGNGTPVKSPTKASRAQVKTMPTLGCL